MLGNKLISLETAKLALYQQVVICQRIIKPAELEEKYFQGLNNSKNQNDFLSIQIMSEKCFTVSEFLTRHFQILQMGVRGGDTPVSYDYAFIA